MNHLFFLGAYSRFSKKEGKSGEPVIRPLRFKN